MSSDNLFARNLFIFQTILLILYGFFVNYDESAVSSEDQSLLVDHFYPTFQDVNVMIFIGFGFLMVFPKLYSFSAVGLNMLLAVVTIEWAIVCRAFWEMSFAGEFHDIEIGIVQMILALFSAAVVLITFGVVLGSATPSQLLAIAVIETFFATLSETLVITQFSPSDIGGSMVVHAFGGMFGVACSYGMVKTGYNPQSADQSSVYNSDVMAMIGTLFLWMYWPSFNGALAIGNQQHRVFINTFLSLCASCLTTFATSRYLHPESKLDMVHIQNATLAGGVAVGSVANLVLHPWGAMLIGTVSGFLSVFGYVHFSPGLTEKIGLNDTCGVLNLHLIPGIMSGIASVFAAGFADSDDYGEGISVAFPEMADGRSSGSQAWYQLATLAVSLVIACASGFVTGGFVTKFFAHPEMIFDDGLHWELPERVDELEKAHEMQEVGLIHQA